MSDTQVNPQAPVSPKLSLLQQFIQQRDAFIQQSAQIQSQFQQLQGAIFACNTMIEKIELEAKEHMEAMAKKVQEDLNKDNQGENVNGEADCEAEEQVA